MSVYYGEVGCGIGVFVVELVDGLVVWCVGVVG